jgi:hypothetical protein
MALGLIPTRRAVAVHHNRPCDTNSWTAGLFQIVTLHELDPDAAGSFDERETHRGAAW